MSGYWYKNGQTGAIVRIKLNNSSATNPTNAGVTGLSSSSTGLILSTMCDVEATPTYYTQAAGTIGAVATLGTYAAPSAGTCNFSQVSATYFPGWYEIQFLNARFAVSGAKFIGICVPAVSGLNLAQQDLVIPLTDMDPYSRAYQFQSQMTEGYSANGTAPTPEQAMFEILGFQQQKVVVGTTMTINGLNGSTAKMTFTLNSSGTPTSITRAT